MVIYNCHLSDTIFRPDKANAILVIDANAVLSLPIAKQFFKTVGRGDTQVIKGDRIVQHGQFAFGNRFYRTEMASFSSCKSELCIATSKLFIICHLFIICVLYCLSILYIDKQ